MRLAAVAPIDLAECLTGHLAGQTETIDTSPFPEKGGSHPYQADT